MEPTPQQEPQPQETFSTPPVDSTPPSAPAPVPIPTPAPVQKKKTDKKMIIMLAAIALLVVAVGVLAYLLMSKDNDTTANNAQPAADSAQQSKEAVAQTEEETATPADETTGWETLTNATYGISYKYPSGDSWSASLSDASSSTGLVASGGVNYTQCGPNCGLALTINVVEKGSVNDPGDTYGIKQFAGNNYYKLTSTSNVTKGSATGTRWEYTPGDDQAASTVLYYFSKGNQVYMFDVNVNGAKTDGVDITAMGEKIMNTLRFEN